MPEHRFHSLLRERVQAEINKLGENIVRGGCEDISNYKHQTGIIVGLQVSLELADELEKDMD